MPLSRRAFLADASALGMLAALLPQLAAAQHPLRLRLIQARWDLPHDSYDFWNGFFDSVNPYSAVYGNKAASRGPTDQLPDPEAQTQYLHYDNDNKRLRYASDIRKEELLDHDGDVGGQHCPRPVSARGRRNQSEGLATARRHNASSPFREYPHASRLVGHRVGFPEQMRAKFHSTRSAFARPRPCRAPARSCSQEGTGKLAVNISRAAAQSMFLKALNIMIQGAKIAAPIVSLPAISVPALSTFTEALSYWEDRTRFIMSGNLTHAVATQQALDDPDRDPAYIGLDRATT